MGRRGYPGLEGKKLTKKLVEVLLSAEKKHTKVSYSSEAPSKLNCAVVKHISKLLRVQRTLDRISVMTPACCGDLPDGKVLDDHKQISIRGKNGHKAEPAQDPASTMMMKGWLKVVYKVKGRRFVVHDESG